MFEAIETTPAFLVDLPTARRNCDRMRAKAVRSAVTFRPHVKTHKTIEGALLQHGGSPGPITVSTLAEAELFADHRFEDITYAVPIAPHALQRAARLASRIERLAILIDHPSTVKAAAAAAASAGIRFDVDVKIDCGYHRAGLEPENPLLAEIVAMIESSDSLRLDAFLTHAGHSYHATSVEQIARIEREEADAVNRARQVAGRKAVRRSVGSTPTASVVEQFDDVDEVRPGNYIFFDAFQATLGSATRDDCAASVLTTVLAVYDDRLIVDAGALALSKDRGADHLVDDPGFGFVSDVAMNPLPLKIVALSQEHGIVKPANGGRLHDIAVRLEPGTRLRIVPNHSCLTAAMFDRYVVVDDAAIVDEWTPARGW